MSDKFVINKNYIKSLLKSHKEIRDSYLSRYSQAIDRINSLESDIIYTTSLPGLDYSNSAVHTSSINDSTFNAYAKLDVIRKTEEIYKELEYMRTKIDEIDYIFDIYRALQSFIPVHYEITNRLLYLDEGYDFCASHFGRSNDTINKMVDSTIELICRLFNDDLDVNKLNEMSLDEFISYIGEVEYSSLYKRENKLKH